MKRIVFLFLLLPAIGFSQVKKQKTKAASKTTVINNASNVVITPMVNPPMLVNDGFSISGTISGVPDGTVLKMLNGNNGAEEQSYNIQKGKFTFSGKLAAPEFKLLGINGQPPFITLFIDNSKINITASKDSMENALVSGSPAHADYLSFSTIMKPYEGLLSGKGRYSVEFMDQAAAVLEHFVTGHPKSFITALALYRQYQITGDYTKLETLYKGMDPSVQTSPIGNYISGQIESNKQTAYGKPLTNFSQADTSGKEISLTAFKGKYVLVDFWASWCGPCRAENPNVVSMYEKYKKKNFTVLGVSLDQNKEKWINAIAADHLTWTHVSDLKGWGNAVAAQFGIQQIPQNFLLDPQGNLIGKNLRASALEYRLAKVLK